MYLLIQQTLDFNRVAHNLAEVGDEGKEVIYVDDAIGDDIKGPIEIGFHVIAAEGAYKGKEVVETDL